MPHDVKSGFHGRKRRPAWKLFRRAWKDKGGSCRRSAGRGGGHAPRPWMFVPVWRRSVEAVGTTPCGRPDCTLRRVLEYFPQSTLPHSASPRCASGNIGCVPALFIHRIAGVKEAGNRGIGEYPPGRKPAGGGSIKKAPLEDFPQGEAFQGRESGRPLRGRSRLAIPY